MKKKLVVIALCLAFMGIVPPLDTPLIYPHRDVRKPLSATNQANMLQQGGDVSFTAQPTVRLILPGTLRIARKRQPVRIPALMIRP